MAVSSRVAVSDDAGQNVNSVYLVLVIAYVSASHGKKD
jgi:hypothetical protein